MATVGQMLTAPEAGWKRYDDRNSCFSYSEGFVPGTNSADYNSTWTQVVSNTGGYVRFNFVGSKIRIISIYCTAYPQNAYILIDGNEESFLINPGNINLRQVLVYEKLGLDNKEHSVEIIQKDGSALGFVLDAVDIDDTGEIKPFNPISSLNLTAAAGDSKVTLSWTAVDGATGYNVKRSTTAEGPYTTIAPNVQGTSYVDSAVTNGTTYYYVVTAITANGESANSNEASATPKAEVTPPTGNDLLRVIMSDSSEREYKLLVAEIDKFINWINGAGKNGDNIYKFADVIDGSKEYLIFDKIISFKVVPVLNK